jgi:branched-chain amino acid transport system permease protein/neutral amino acid transport system permease protein
VARTRTITWAISGALCGLGGVALGISSASFSNLSGDDFLFVVFAAAVVGGLGEAYGAILGALVIGIVTEEVAAFSPNLQYVAAFGILVVMLLARPGGIIRSGGRVRADTVVA